MKRGGGRRRRPRKEFQEEPWVPRTKLGRMVEKGEITKIEEIFQGGHRIMEPQIVDALLPDLVDDVIKIQLVQRQTDAGRKRSFKITCAVGNMRGYVGIGESKSKEVGPGIRKAIAIAKTNISPVKRGCGSWECTCSDPHSLPFRVEGKMASTRVTLLPAPKGLGLVIGATARQVLTLAGIQDIWSATKGDTRTKPNFAKAVFEALKNTYRVVDPNEKEIEVEEVVESVEVEADALQVEFDEEDSSSTIEDLSVSEDEGMGTESN